jgi:hypothetical protein
VLTVGISTVQWNVNSGEENAEEEDECGGGEARRLTCGGIEAVLMAAATLLSRWRDRSGQRCSVFFSSFSLLCFSLFSASSSSSFFFFRFFLYSALSLLFSSFFFVPSVLSLWSCLPYIYRKTGERHGWGGHCAAAPPQPVQHVESFLGKWVSLVGVFFMLFRGRKSVKTGGRKIFFFPYLARPGEEEDPQCRQNSTVWASLFFLNEQCVKRHRFSQNTPFHLNENWRQNASNSKSGLEFARGLQFGPWSRIPSIKSLIGHQTLVFMQLSP